LTYLRDRLLLARELLADSGSVFVQISDENVHLVRNLCDEIFGTANFFSLITVRKTGGLGSSGLTSVADYIICYNKDKQEAKYHQLFINKLEGAILEQYNQAIFPDGRIVTIKKGEDTPVGAKRFSATSLHTMFAGVESCLYSFDLDGKTFALPPNRQWSTTLPNMLRLAKENRIYTNGNTPRYIRYIDDFPVAEINNLWADLMGSDDKIYVVQTSNKVIQRCLLMTTDPGDLVLDITCGSGTTAYVAEQWGRRWITCDTSRIAVTLAKKRLMTATYDYYKLAHPDQGVSSGFVYKTVPHITLKSIANSEPPERETLYDQPEIEKRKVRISGPFTVEALPAPAVKPLDDDLSPAPFVYENAAKKQSDWMQELRAAGILGRGGEKIQFSRVEALEGTKFLHAEAETKEAESRRAVICFAGETRPLDARTVNQALGEAENVRPKPAYIIFAAFQFDPAAARNIDDTKWPGVTLLKVLMNTDLMTADLKKKSSGSQSFWLIGQPDVELVKIGGGADGGANCGEYKIKVKGFDYYDVKKGVVESGGTDKIAVWMLDTDYDGMCVEPKQVYFPMDGKNEGWDKLAKTLKAEIDQELIEKYRGTESLPFAVKDNTLIAVKIVDDRGIESLKVISIGGRGG
jgi:adenine-specific DNA-methyltransferase